jgi:hypothetical protein
MCRHFATICQFHHHGWCEQEHFLMEGTNIFAISIQTFTLQPVLTPPMKMELTECSETSPHKIQAPGNHPKETLKHVLKCL